jgi:magnesium transporter
MNVHDPLTMAKELLQSPVKRLLRSGKKGVGSAPGTLVYTGPPRTAPVAIHLMEYDKEKVAESTLSPESDFPAIARLDPITWINVDGLSDIGLIQSLGQAFNLHPLVLEDLVNTHQRPKMEEYDDHIFLVLRMLTLGGDGVSVMSEQIGLILGDGFVLSFQERAGDVWDQVRERIRGKTSRLRTRGSDYLAYALTDAVVDHYFHVLESLADRAEELELEVLDSPPPQTLHQIHQLRHEMLVVRRAVWPLREATSSLLRTESELVKEETGIFLRDVYDHAVQVIDSTETLRDIGSSLMDLYLSSVSNRMNEIMKVLTIMASIFIPLTFLAGIYGMNFQVMPELALPWAYPTLLGVMGAVGIVMLLYFKRKGWL